jgi:hypothetical protein
MACMHIELFFSLPVAGASYNIVALRPSKCWEEEPCDYKELLESSLEDGD